MPYPSRNLTVFPWMFDAVGDGVADDTGAWRAAIDAARERGGVVAGLDRTYAIQRLDIPTGCEIRNARFIDIGPEVTAEHYTIRCANDGTPHTGRISLKNIQIDRNRSGSGNHKAIYFRFVDEVRLDCLEVFGNGKGDVVAIEHCNKVDVDYYGHDLRYTHDASVDNDIINGIVFSDVRSLNGRVIVHRMGRTDLAVAERDLYSRGVVLDRVRGGSLDVDVYRCGQGVDASGYGRSRLQIRGTIRHCYSIGMKFAHGNDHTVISNLLIEQCGRFGAGIGGPASTEKQGNYPVGGLITGLKIRNIGSNGSRAAFGDTAGIGLLRNDPDAPWREFPKGILVATNLIASDRGTTTFTVVDSATLTVPDGTVPLNSGVRVRLATTGRLPGPLAAETDYWLVVDEDSRQFALAASHNDAQDAMDGIPGKIISGLFGGRGTHTITLQSDMVNGIEAQELSFLDRDHPNLALNNKIVGATGLAVKNMAAPYCSLTKSAQSIENAGPTDVLWTSGTSLLPAFDEATGVVEIPMSGQYTVSARIRFAANPDGVRVAVLLYDAGAAGTYVELDRSELLAQGSLETHLPLGHLGNFVEGGKLKVRAYQDSGGALDIRSTSTFQLAMIGSWNSGL